MARTRVYAFNRPVVKLCPVQPARMDRKAAEMDEPGSDEEDPWTEGCKQAWDSLAHTSAEVAMQVALVDAATDGTDAKGAADVRAAL